jgi:hypothetical protein
VVTTIVTKAASVIGINTAEATDEQYFFDNPQKQYRLRPDGWVVRRRAGGAFLRTPLPGAAAYPDREVVAEALWWRMAWPELSPKARNTLMQAARWRGKPIKDREYPHVFDIEEG